MHYGLDRSSYPDVLLYVVMIKRNTYNGKIRNAAAAAAIVIKAKTSPVRHESVATFTMTTATYIMLLLHHTALARLFRQRNFFGLLCFRFLGARTAHFRLDRLRRGGAL